ncbi:hypothetical protein BDZ89DRAFT_1037978, partial [Hymenopellis radicata]
HPEKTLELAITKEEWIQSSRLQPTGEQEVESEESESDLEASNAEEGEDPDLQEPSTSLSNIFLVANLSVVKDSSKTSEEKTLSTSEQFDVKDMGITLPNNDPRSKLNARLRYNWKRYIQSDLEEYIQLVNRRGTGGIESLWSEDDEPIVALLSQLGNTTSETSDGRLHIITQEPDGIRLIPNSDASSVPESGHSSSTSSDEYDSSYESSNSDDRQRRHNFVEETLRDIERDFHRQNPTPSTSYYSPSYPSSRSSHHSERSLSPVRRQDHLQDLEVRIRQNVTVRPHHYPYYFHRPPGAPSAHLSYRDYNPQWERPSRRRRSDTSTPSNVSNRENEPILNGVRSQTNSPTSFAGYSGPHSTDASIHLHIPQSEATEIASMTANMHLNGRQEPFQNHSHLNHTGIQETRDIFIAEHNESDSKTDSEMPGLITVSDSDYDSSDEDDSDKDISSVKQYTSQAHPFVTYQRLKRLAVDKKGDKLLAPKKEGPIGASHPSNTPITAGRLTEEDRFAYGSSSLSPKNESLEKLRLEYLTKGETLADVPERMTCWICIHGDLVDRRMGGNQIQKGGVREHKHVKESAMKRIGTAGSSVSNAVIRMTGDVTSQDDTSRTRQDLNENTEKSGREQSEDRERKNESLYDDTRQTVRSTSRQTGRDVLESENEQTAGDAPLRKILSCETRVSYETATKGNDATISIRPSPTKYYGDNVPDKPQDDVASQTLRSDPISPSSRAFPSSLEIDDPRKQRRIRQSGELSSQSREDVLWRYDEEVGKERDALDNDKSEKVLLPKLAITVRCKDGAEVVKTQRILGEEDKKKPAGGEDEKYKKDKDEMVVVQDQPTSAQPPDFDSPSSNPISFIFLNLRSVLPMPQARAPTAVSCLSFQPSVDNFRAVKATICNSTDEGAQDFVRQYEHVFPTAPRPNNAPQPDPVNCEAVFARDVTDQFAGVLRTLLPQIRSGSEKFHLTIAVAATRKTLLDQTAMVNARVMTFEEGKDPAVRIGHACLLQLGDVVEPCLMPPAERGPGGDPLPYLANMDPSVIGFTPDGRAPRLRHSGPLIALDTVAQGEDPEIDADGDWTVAPCEVDPRRNELAAYDHHAQNCDKTGPQVAIDHKKLQELLIRTNFTPEARTFIAGTLENLVRVVGNSKVMFLNQLRLLPDVGQEPYAPFGKPTRFAHIMSYISLLNILMDPNLILFKDEDALYSSFPLNAPTIKAASAASDLLPSSTFPSRDLSPIFSSVSSSPSYHPSSPPLNWARSPAWDTFAVSNKENIPTFDYEQWSAEIAKAEVATREAPSPSLDINEPLTVDPSLLEPLHFDNRSETLSAADEDEPMEFRRAPTPFPPAIRKFEDFDTFTLDNSYSAPTTSTPAHCSESARRPHSTLIDQSAPLTQSSGSSVRTGGNHCAPTSGRDSDMATPIEASREVNFTEARLSSLSNPIIETFSRIIGEGEYGDLSPIKRDIFEDEDDFSDMDTDDLESDVDSEEGRPTGLSVHDAVPVTTSDVSSAVLGSEGHTSGNESQNQELLAVRGPSPTPVLAPAQIPVPFDIPSTPSVRPLPLIHTPILPPTQFTAPKTLQALRPQLKGENFALRTRHPDNTGYADTTLVDKCRHIDNIFVEPDVVGRGAIGHPYSDVDVIPQYSMTPRLYMILFDGVSDNHPLRDHGIFHAQTSDSLFDDGHMGDISVWYRNTWTREMYRLYARQDYPLDEGQLVLTNAHPAVHEAAERIREYKPIFESYIRLSDNHSFDAPPLPPAIRREPLPPVWYEARLPEEFPTRLHMMVVRKSGVQSMCANDITTSVVSYLDPHFDGRPEIKYNAWVQPNDLDFIRDSRFRFVTLINQFIRHLACASTRARVDSLPASHPTHHFFYYHSVPLRYLSSDVDDARQGFNVYCTHADPSYVGSPPYPPCSPLVPINPCLSVEEDEFLFHMSLLFRLEGYDHLANCVTNLRGMRFFLPDELRILFANGYLDPLHHFDHLGHKYPYTG